MTYYLSRRAVLKWLETPSVYQLTRDELYELDSDSFRFLKNCSSSDGCAPHDGAFTDYCLEEGLLTREPVSIVRPGLKQSPDPSLRYLELQITAACNLKCKHCYIGDADHHELTPKQVAAILHEFEDMQGLRVLITGGEPLLHSKFKEINELLPEFFIRKILFTNGILLTKQTLKTLKVDEIQVSIDGLEPAHERIRGTGTYKRSLAAMQQALDSGFDVSVSTMVHSYNLADFDGMERLFKEMGIKDWTVDVPCSVGRLKEHEDFLVSPEEGGKFLGYGYGSGLHSPAEGFGCGRHLLSVMADGKIAKCSFYHDQPVGSLEQGLRAAWKALTPVKLKDLACNCEYLEICRGGCRYRAELLEGKKGRDRYRCALYDIL